MTIASENQRNDYTGNGATSVYSYTFKILNNSDLKVTQRDTDNVETELVLSTDYTITGVGDAGGGSITLTAGNLTTDYHLTIRLDATLKQETDIRNQGTFYPEGHEDAFDHQVNISKTQQAQLDRAIKIPATYPDMSVDLPAPIAGKVLKINETGTGFILIDVGDATLAIPADDSITTSMYTTAAYPVLLVGAQTIAGLKTMTSSFKITNSAPLLRLQETGVTADNGLWWLYVDGERLYLKVRNDADNAGNDILTVDRTGTTVDTINLQPTNLQHNGVSVPTISSTSTLSNKTFSDAIIASGGIQTDGANVLKTKVIDIGDWDMTTATGTATVAIAHGLTLADIRSIDVGIYADGGGTIRPLDYNVAGNTCAGYWYTDATNVNLGRVAGGSFDGTQYDSTSFNRGWITITYIA
jgi:hypothetical protein